MKNFNKTTKTILFASLIAAMILSFSGMDFAKAEVDKPIKHASIKIITIILDPSEIENQSNELVLIPMSKEQKQIHELIANNPGPITLDDLTLGTFTSVINDVTIDVSNMDTLWGQN